MCGIVGIMADLSGDECLRIVRRMNKALEHRGPDDEGSWSEAGFGFGMRRLSIIDLSGGHQPMWDERGDLGVVLNGEIYNYKSLTEQLSRGGVEVSHRRVTRKWRSTSLCRFGAGRGPQLERNVCGGGLGQARKKAPDNPRPDGRQAALLLLGRADLSVRLRDQSAARLGPCAAPDQPASALGLPHVSIHARPGNYLGGDQKAASGPCAGGQAGTAPS